MAEHQHHSFEMVECDIANEVDYWQCGGCEAVFESPCPFVSHEADWSPYDIPPLSAMKRVE